MLFAGCAVPSSAPLATPTDAVATAEPTASTANTPAPDDASPTVAPTSELTPTAASLVTAQPDNTEILALPPEDETSARLQAPDGFAVRIFASGLQGPRLIAVGPDGNLYVAERGVGVVVRLPDADDDGLADERQVVADNLSAPNNVEWADGSLYVGEENRITRWTDNNDDGDFTDEGERQVVTEDIPTRGQHTSRTVRSGPAGKVYVAAGSSGNNDVEEDWRRGTIMRFNPDGTIPDDNPFVNDAEPTRHSVWAEGLRNSVDFLFLPDGRLWANHNGSDLLGDDAPPEEIVIEIEKGKHYGWPYCYTPALGFVPAGTQEVRDERVPFDRLRSCAEATPALFTDLAHSAPLGMARYAADASSAFPQEYRDNLFVAYHGSWNSSEPRDCKVQRIVVRDCAPVESQAFLTGFRDNEEQDCGAAWGRPAGVAVGANGELFVSDDQNGNIYRVIYTGS
jgi:glucose/arabinose dehydrogenase